MKRNTILMLALSGAFGSQQVVAAPTLEEKLDIMQQEIEVLKAQSGKNSTGHSASGSGNTSIGGYGEAVYNNYSDSSKKNEADLKRFVIFLGHKFSDRVRLVSELEVEHAKADKDGGEVAMEQAYVEYGMTDTMNARYGLMLMPMGITNETHEPPTFYGVERNEVESRIIPSTWRELGIALQGEAAAGLEYNVGISTTPDASKYKDASKGFRDMRGSGRQVAANDLGLFGALNFRGVPGLLVGASIFSGNTAQEGNGATSKTALMGVDAKLTLWDVHAKYTLGALDLQALYAKGKLGDTAQINTAANTCTVTPPVCTLPLGSNKAAPESFYGWYGQAGFRVWQDGDKDVTPFVRYERYNTQESVAAGYTTNPLNDETVTTVGVNFRLHPQVVLKADVQNFKADPLKDRFNLGVGYMF